jgi:uncharacterized protein
MGRNLVGWFEIYVDDLRRARTFYESVFRTTFTKIDSKMPEMWQFAFTLQSCGSPGALVHMPGFAAGNNSVIVYFSCEDCAVEEKRAVEAGGRVQKPKFAVGQYDFISLVLDSEGNMIGLHSLK